MFTESNGYEDFMGRWSRQLARLYVAFAGPRDGDRVLDVGTGTGALASALERALPASDIVGIDPSAGFIEFARRSATSPRSRFELGDAQALQFADSSFDQTMSLLVINFIADHVKAIGEMRRVTRPGGLVSACVWDYDAGMQMLRIFWDEVVALDPAMASRDERNMKLTLERQLRGLWTQAGFDAVSEQPLSIEQTFASFDDYWAPFLAGVGPAGAYVAALGGDKRRELEARLRKRLLGARSDGGFVLTARAWCVRGRVPGGA
ncbi:MAG: methyltransferase domain-containing protein [Rubrivivax sp.]